MCRKRWVPLVLIAGLLLLLVLAACGSQGQPFKVTFGTFDELPRTADEALAKGWKQYEECFPNMGLHFMKPAPDPNDSTVVTWLGEPIDSVVLITDSKGDTIGFEVASLSKQPSPPWEHYPDGFPGLEYELWALHFYSSDPVDACEK